MSHLSSPVTVIMPLAGKGERFVRCGYQRPKPLVQVLGRPLVLRVIESLGLSPEDSLLVVYHSSLEQEGIADLISNSFPDLQIAFCRIEQRTRGAAETVLRGFDVIPIEALAGPALVADGDGIVDPSLLASFRRTPGNVVFFTHNEVGDPIYSYVEVDEHFHVRRIAEKIRLSPYACIGMYGFVSASLLQRAARTTLEINRPQSREYYLSNAVQVLLEEGQEVRAESVGAWACLGTPGQLQSWCLQQVLLSRLERTHTRFDPVPRLPTHTMDRLERESVERESGYYLPQPIPARPWHHIVFSTDTVEKSGLSREVDHELTWYRNLPRRLAPHVPKLISHCTVGSTTLLKLDRVPGVPFCHLFVEELLTERDLEALLGVLANFHASDLAEVPPIPGGATIYDSYSPKLSDRFERIGALPGAEECYRVLVARADEYQASGRGREALIHGDPVFTNVLLTPGGKVVLVDPREHLHGQSTLRGDANYDLAKVYQSLVGYDAILLGRDSPFGAAQLLARYEEWLVQVVGADGLGDIQWITASLYLSLIPLHETRHHGAFLDLCLKLIHSDRGK